MLDARIVIAMSALTALTACNGAQAIPNAGEAATRDAATRDAATRDAHVARADASPQQPTPSELPVDPCVVGSTIGAGIMSGVLEGEQPIMAPTTTLDRFPKLVPASLQGMTLSVPSKLQLREGGMLAVSRAGFFDIGANGLARFQLVANRGDSLAALSGDLDDDGDEDIVAVATAISGLDTDAGIPLPTAALTLFERSADGQLRQRSHFQADTPLVTLGSAVALADHDADGDRDLLLFDFNGTPYALRSDGELAFTEVALGEPTSDIFVAQALIAEDRDGDGAIDLAVVGDAIALDMVGQAPTHLEMRVYLNDGAGRFAAPVVSPLSAPTAPTECAWGDVTGDGLADLVLLREHVAIAESLDATRIADAVELSAIAQGLALGDADGDGVLDIGAYSHEGIDVLQVRSGLEIESTHFDVPAHALKAIALERVNADEPARLHALYHAGCSLPCDQSCALSCIFEACVECIAHSDCGNGSACVVGECRSL
jgi:hypothetical protein